MIVIKTIKILVLILLNIMFVYNLIYVFTTTINPDTKEDIKLFNIKGYIIQDSSQTNDFKNNDLVLVKEATEKELNIGDVIAFKSNKILKIHRIVKEEKENAKVYYITKGDGNFNLDLEKLTVENIEGKVFKKIYIVRSNHESFTNKNCNYNYNDSFNFLLYNKQDNKKESAKKKDNKKELKYLNYNKNYRIIKLLY